MTIHTIEQAVRANQSAGQHFFDRDTLRSFHSRIGQTVYPVPGGAFFVTSETDARGEDRRYTVRHITDDGHTSTRGGYLDGFRRFGLRTNAHRYALQCQRKALALSAARAAAVARGEIAECGCDLLAYPAGYVCRHQRAES